MKTFGGAVIGLTVLSLGSAVGASQITTVSIINGFPSYQTGPAFDPAAGAYPANDAIDGNLGTDYASNGGGTQTFLDFSLGSPQNIGQIILTDRTSSGGPNGSHFHGTSEFNTAYKFEFSNDPTFPSGSTTIDPKTAKPPVNPPAGAAGDSAFSTTFNFSGITAQYVRWQVTSGSGNNGIAEIQFFTPEPGSLAMLALAGLALVARRR